jgi:hypothetical protein
MTNNPKNQAIYVTTGDPTTVNEATPYAPGQLGKEISVYNTSAGINPGQGAKTFKYVQVDSTSASPYKGSVAWWSDRDALKVTLSATNRGQVAGVFQASAPNPGNFGYLQIGGVGAVKLVNAPTAAPSAAGAFVIPSATDGKADCLAAGSAAIYAPIGQALGTANPGDNTVECIIILDTVGNV